jgi:predicted DNA-binding transcriptional regulator YafY
MELLSYGEYVEVLEPASLRKKIQEKLEAALAVYEK